MSHEKQEIEAFNKDNTEVKFRMELSQQDLMEAAVSKKEEEYYAIILNIKRQIKGLESEVKDLQKVMDDGAKVLFESKHQATLDNITSLVGIFNKSLTTSYKVDSNNAAAAITSYSVTLSDNGSSSRYSGYSKSLTVSHGIVIEWDAEMKEANKKREELKEELLKLREEEYDINDKLSNIDRLLRKAKAAITVSALEKSGLGDLIPELPETLEK